MEKVLICGGLIFKVQGSQRAPLVDAGASDEPGLCATITTGDLMIHISTVFLVPYLVLEY